MNKQDKGNGSRGIEWTDYTTNPIAGCLHDCQWSMPDGKIATCYAEDVADRVAGSQYPQGFRHHYWKPDKLDDPLKLKTPAKIFIGSMADVFGAWVPDEQIRAVLDVCRQADWHVFQLLTKNAPRLLQFDFPPNVWVGVSSPPDFMFGKRLSPLQQEAILNRSLHVLRHVGAPVKWMSFEPLSWNVANHIRHLPALQWAVIGAASDGNRYYPPNETDLRDLLAVLDGQDCPVFFKGNLESLDWAACNWREDFPVARQPEARQLALWGES